MRRTAVVSSGASSASDVPLPSAATPPTADMPARKLRRDCMICIKATSIPVGAGAARLLTPSACADSFRRCQSVPSARSWLGLDLIMPTSCRRSA